MPVPAQFVAHMLTHWFDCRAGHSSAITSHAASHVVPHAPPPLGPACAQCIAGLLRASSVCVTRQASELPIIAPAVPMVAIALQVDMQFATDSYCSFAPAHASVIAAQ